MIRMKVNARNGSAVIVVLLSGRIYQRLVVAEVVGGVDVVVAEVD